MTIRSILIWPEPLLAQTAAPVDKVDDEIRRLIDDMFETMYDANGVGLAAPQVGVAKRVLVIDLGHRGEGKRRDDEDAAALVEMGFTGPVAVINPQFVRKEGKIVWEEGCLSVPGYVDEVERAAEVTVRFLDRNGKAQEVAAKNLFAVALQHEADHLDGVVFVEYLSRLKRDLVKRKMTKLKQSETVPEKHETPIL